MPAADWGLEIPGGFFHEEQHIYRNTKGTIVPSSTQVFSILGLSDFSMIDPATLSWKREYGNAVHAAVEYLVMGDLDWDTLDEEIIAPVTGIECRLRDMKFEVEATEERRIASIFGMEFGSTLDLRGFSEHKGQRRSTIVDLKTGSKFSPTWAWQIGSYASVQERVDKGWLGVVLQVAPDGRITPHYVDVFKTAREFQCLLGAAILKINAGYNW